MLATSTGTKREEHQYYYADLMAFKDDSIFFKEKFDDIEERYADQAEQIEV